VPDLGRALLIAGGVLLILGLLLTLGTRLPGVGRLPGDFVYRKGNFTFYFPVVTCILLSVVLTLLLRIFRR
jgi:Protein of unknown function (DUF2905)